MFPQSKIGNIYTANQSVNFRFESRIGYHLKELHFAIPFLIPLLINNIID